MEFFELDQHIFGPPLRPPETFATEWGIFLRIYYKEGFIDWTRQNGLTLPFLLPYASPVHRYEYYRLNGADTWRIEWCFVAKMANWTCNNPKTMTAQEVWNKSLRIHTNPTPLNQHDLYETLY